MATRPIGNPPIWSSIDFYPPGVDPWSGNDRSVTIPTGEAGGFTPDTGIVAEYANAEFKVLSTWVEWLSFGSNAAGLDAHVVETDPTGVSAIAGLTAGGTAGAFPAITATANAGATGSVISATNNSGGFAILASVSGALAAVRGVSTGAGPGIEGLATVGGGNGVKGTGDGSAAGVIGLGDTGGTGPGGEFTGGGTGGVGVIGKAQASVFGVSGISSGTNGGAGSGGVSGTATRNDSVGVAGFALIAGANPLVDTTPAVLGSAFDATAVYGKSTNGYGVWAESTGVIRASLHVEPQASDPIAPLEGDVWYNAAEDKLKGRISSFNMGLWSTRRGYTYAIEEQVGSINTVSTTFQTVITASFTTQTEPIIGSVLTFSVIFEMGCSVIGGSGAEEFEWQVLDVTDGVATPIPPRLEVSHVASTFADERYVTAKASYTVAAAGAQSFALEVRSLNPVPAVRIRRAVMEITGSHG